MKTISIFLLIAATTFAALGQVLFKVGAQGNTSWSGYLSPSIFVGGLCYIIGTVVWVYVLSTERLVDVYAFSGLSFVFVYLAGIFYLNEKVELMAMLGVSLVVIGISLVVLNSSK